MNKIRVFISQGMRDKSPEEIRNERHFAIDDVRKILEDKEVEIIDSYLPGKFNEAILKNKALAFLGESLKLLAEADYVYFLPDWREFRGCSLEHTCAEEYGVEILKD